MTVFLHLSVPFFLVIFPFLLVCGVICGDAQKKDDRYYPLPASLNSITTAIDRAFPPAMFAAAYGDVVQLSDIVTRSPNPVRAVNVRDWVRQTPLHLAAKFGKLATVRYLVENGANVNPRNRDFDETPLHLAAKSGYGDIVKYLIESGAEVDTSVDPKSNFTYIFSGGTPMMYAIENNDAASLQVVKILVEIGHANISLPNLLSQTPLHLAVIVQHLELVKYLLDRGANIDAKDSYKRSPLNALVSDTSVKPQLPMIAFLLKRGATLESADMFGRTPVQNAVLQGYKTVVRYLLQQGANINSRNPFGRTILHRVITGGTKVRRVDTVRFLLQHGADVNAGTANGCNRPLVDLVNLPDEDFRDSQSVLMEIAWILKNHGAEPRFRDPCIRKTPLDIAAQRGYADLVQVLGKNSIADFQMEQEIPFEENSDLAIFPQIATDQLEDIIEKLAKSSYEIVDQRDWLNQTALHLSSHLGLTHVSMVLVCFGYDLHSRDVSLRTPLSNAAQMGNVKLIEYLLDRGADIEVKDKWGLTPLLAAAGYSGSPKAVNYLIKRGANLGATDNRGLSALHMAAVNQNLEMMQVLLAASFPANFRDSMTGSTPLNYLFQSKCCYPQIPTVDLLLKSGADINSRDKFGRVPLHGAVASRKGYEIILYLLYHGADATAVDGAGCNSPLLSFIKASLNDTRYAEFEVAGTVKWLLYYGADPMFTDPCTHESAISFTERTTRRLVASVLRRPKSSYYKDIPDYYPDY